MELGVRALLVELMVETRTGRRGAGFSLAFKSETDSILADDLHFLFPPTASLVPSLAWGLVSSWNLTSCQPHRSPQDEGGWGVGGGG